MPAEDYWETLLDVDAILARFHLDTTTRDVAELGCGYGTFTLPLARRIAGRVHAIDIDGTMVERTAVRAAQEGIRNIATAQRDILMQGYGCPDESCDAGLLFNILHGESPVELLRETARVVRPGGMLGRDSLAHRHRHATRSERGDSSTAQANCRVGHSCRKPQPDGRTVRTAALSLRHGLHPTALALSA